MKSDKHAPDSLKYQWRLYGLVVRSDWATSLDKSVAYEIVDNYYAKFGNSRTSLSFLEKATGATRTNVVASTRRLIENGPFSIIRLGRGTRPTEYKLHFDKVAENASGIADDTTSTDSPSSIAYDTTGGIAYDTTSGSSSIAYDTQTDLQEPAYKAELQVGRNIDTHDAPLAGPVGAAAAPRVPESAFDKFWKAYPRKFQKPKARAAWDKLNPSQELAERIIEAAGLWAEHYTAHPIEKKWMPAPANWLAGERYDEDLPDVYEDPKERAIAKAKDKPANTNQPPKVGETRMYRITAYHCDNWFQTEVYVKFTLEDEDGAAQDFHLQVANINGTVPVNAGSLNSLNAAVSGDLVYSIGQFVWMRTKSDGGMVFEAVAAADNPMCKEITATLTRVGITDEPDCTYLELEFNEESGMEYECITLESAKPEDYEDGRRRFAAFAASLGIVPTAESETDDWIGMTVRVLHDGENVVEWLPKLSEAA